MKMWEKILSFRKQKPSFYIETCVLHYTCYITLKRIKDCYSHFPAPSDRFFLSLAVKLAKLNQSIIKNLPTPKLPPHPHCPRWLFLVKQLLQSPSRFLPAGQWSSLAPCGKEEPFRREPCFCIFRLHPAKFTSAFRRSSPIFAINNLQSQQ